MVISPLTVTAAVRCPIGFARPINVRVTDNQAVQLRIADAVLHVRRVGVEADDQPVSTLDLGRQLIADSGQIAGRHSELGRLGPIH
jgi:hypothetical protein